MAQTSGLGQDESWGWPCPYCRAHNPMDAANCANCGSQLRDPDDDDLFTTVAADNAEVVPPDAPFGRDNMWTTDANEGLDAEQGEFVDEDLWETDPVAPVSEPTGSAFTAEPSRRADDVIDEPFHVDEAATRAGRRSSNGNLFSNGSGHPASDPRVESPSRNGESGRSPFGVPGPEPHHDVWGQDRWSGPAPASSWAGAQPSVAAAPPHPGYGTPPGAAPGPPPGYDQGPASQGSWQYVQAPVPPSAPPAQPLQGDYHAPVPDPHGLSAAVGRLRPTDQEWAAVPISVCGALLRHDEAVLAAVTGQMLGHPAVVVLTTQRVLVVNGRRWQPIVDAFEIGPSLTVRGRHDRDVAALTFVDETRLSTVDGISEVGLAVELAERIKGP